MKSKIVNFMPHIDISRVQTMATGADRGAENAIFGHFYAFFGRKWPSTGPQRQKPQWYVRIKDQALPLG